jgi:fructosamine-3-kinase
MVKDGTMNLVIGIWEEIKTNTIGNNYANGKWKKISLHKKRVKKQLKKLRRKNIRRRNNEKKVIIKEKMARLSKKVCGIMLIRGKRKR